MATQALASSATPLVSGSPKKAMIASPTYLSRVAPYLRADTGHLIEISIENGGQFLRVKVFSGFGKPNDVRKEDRQLFPVRCDLYLLPALENRRVHLRCQIFGQLRRERFELLGSFGKRFRPCLYQRVQFLFAGQHWLTHSAEHASETP